MNATSFPRNLGNIRLDEKLGEGSSGILYKGYHFGLEMDVAVKMLRIDFEWDANHRERFEREARLAARINHQGIVRIFDLRDYQGRPYIIMEYVDGHTLDAFLKRTEGPVSEMVVLKIIHAVSSAMYHAHEMGIIHRDLKPANILITRKGVVKIVDLGLARLEGSPEMTSAKITMGSPLFMSPEAFRGSGAVNHQSDIYSMGVICYRLIFGSYPYNGDSVQDIAYGHIKAGARFDLISKCGKGTVDIVRRMMDSDRKYRYQDFNQVRLDVRSRMAQIKGISDESSSSTVMHRLGYGSQEFTRIFDFLEKRVQGRSTEVDGKKIIHATSRERVVAWMLFMGFLVMVITGFLVIR